MLFTYLYCLFSKVSVSLPVKLLLWYSRFFGVTFVSPVYPHPLSGLQRSFLLFISVNISTDPIPPELCCSSSFSNLIVHPSNLYSLSFLLSYSAYTGILTIYPFLYRFAGKLPPFPAKIYACCCITVAAQLPTLPISAYYFHTINLNGFLANLVAVPLATFLLYAAMLCLIFPFLLSQYLAWIPEVTEKIIMGFLHIFAPYSFNLHHLYPSVPTVLLILYQFVFLYLYFTKPGKKWRRYPCSLSLFSYAGIYPPIFILPIARKSSYFNFLKKVLLY